MSDNSQKLNFPQLLFDFATRRDKDSKQNMAKFMPAHVVKVDNEFVEIAFDVQSNFTLPTVKIPQNFSKYAREPTQVGDKGIFQSIDYYIGGESGQSGGTASLYPRGNLATGSFQPISQTMFPVRDFNQYTVTGGPTGIINQTDDQSTHVEIKKGQIQHYTQPSPGTPSLSPDTATTRTTVPGTITDKVPNPDPSMVATIMTLTPAGLSVSGPPGVGVSANGQSLGTPPPGSVANSYFNHQENVITGTTGWSHSGGAPTKSFGSVIFSTNFTISKLGNKLRVSSLLQMGCTTLDCVQACIFTSDNVAAISLGVNEIFVAGTGIVPVAVEAETTPQSSSVTIEVWAGSVSGTWTVGSSDWGGTLSSTITIEEIAS